MTKQGPEHSVTGDPPFMERWQVRHEGVAIINYMAPGWPDFSVPARVLCQSMSTPTIGTEECLKRTIRYLASHPSVLQVFPRAQVGEMLRVWMDSVWVGDVSIRETCGRGHKERKGGTV